MLVDVGAVDTALLTAGKYGQAHDVKGQYVYRTHPSQGVGQHRCQGSPQEVQRVVACEILGSDKKGKHRKQMPKNLKFHLLVTGCFSIAM